MDRLLYHAILLIIFSFISHHVVNHFAPAPDMCKGGEMLYSMMYLVVPSTTRRGHLSVRLR